MSAPRVAGLVELLNEHDDATYREVLRVPALSLGLFAAPPGHVDTQCPHDVDEVYVVVVAGRTVLDVDGARTHVEAGSVAYVPPHVPHRFVDLPECNFRNHRERTVFAAEAVAALRGGLEPAVLNDTYWWQTRDIVQQGAEVLEVSRPNPQVRRRHGKTDVVGAIAAARAVLSGEATTVPKSHNGPVEALRALKMLQRSGIKARTQAVNQLKALVLTAPDELRERLRCWPNKQLIETCRAFRVRADDDSLAGITRLAMRELAQRIGFLDGQIDSATHRLNRVTSSFAPKLIASHGFGPDTSSSLLLSAGDNPHRSATSARSPPSGASSWFASPPTNAPATTSTSACPKARPRPKPSAASSATSSEKSSPRYREKPSFDSRSIR